MKSTIAVIFAVLVLVLISESPVSSQLVQPTIGVCILSPTSQNNPAAGNTSNSTGPANPPASNSTSNGTVAASPTVNPNPQPGPTTTPTPAGFSYSGFGRILIEALNPAQPKSPGVKFTYVVNGLSNGNHSWHVHTYGDISDKSSGLATGPHFRQCTNCRPTGVEQTYGMIGDGASPIFVTGGSGSGTVTDQVLQLLGDTGIMGRSIVVHGPGGVRVGQCVIGMVGANEPDMTKTPDTVGNRVVGARCDITPTTNPSAPSASGWFEMFESSAGGVEMYYSVSGLPDGNHNFHVHKAGDITAENGTSVLGHFNGTCPFLNLTGAPGTCRPGASLQENGLINNEVPMSVTGGKASGYFIDPVLKLSGPDSMIGRSIVIHGDGATPTPRIAQCVIGATLDTTTRTSNIASYAIATLVGSTGLNAGVAHFSRTPDSTLRVHLTLKNLPFTTVPYAASIGQFGEYQAGQAYWRLLTEAGTLLPDAEGSIHKVFDTNLTLNAADSVLGLSLNLVSGTDVITGTIGMNEANDPTTATAAGYSLPRSTEGYPVSAAGCSFSSPSGLTGRVLFRREAGTNRIVVSLAATGSTPGTPHGFHVHQAGNINSPKFTYTLGHFVGDCVATKCRPNATLQEVGLLYDGKTTPADANGALNITYVDSVIQFDGVRGIVGRSVVVHGVGTESAPRAAQCVIGILARDASAPCAMGFYSANPGMDVCQPCQIGKYSDTTGATSCTDCPATSYGDEVGLPKCKACPENSFVSAVPATSMSQCLCKSGYKGLAPNCTASGDRSSASTHSVSALLAAALFAIALALAF